MPNRNETSLLGSDKFWHEVDEYSKLQDRIANSKQTFDRVNTLQSSVNNLQSNVNMLENQLRELHQHNWIIPRFHIQGLNGYICHLCNTFSFRPVMDLGYDLTMQCKHNCFRQLGGFTTSIPKEVQDVEGWAAKILLDQMSYYESIGKCFMLSDMSKVFHLWNNEYRDIVFGIPDRHPLIAINDEHILDLIDNTRKNPGKKILLGDSQILEILKKTKSTYSILELPQKGGAKYFYMRFIK